MGKLARRNAKKRELLGQGQTIELRNPQKANFGAFVVGNHDHWFRLAMSELAEKAPEVARELADFEVPPNDTILPHAIAAIDKAGTETFVVQENSGQGRELVICGAGPSLKEHAAEYCTKDRDVWGCNSALTWLADNGHRVTAGFTVDQTLEMLQEWNQTPDVEHLLATTVHTNLTELLLKRGKKIRFFHNYAGIDGPPQTHDGETMCYEDWLYCALFPSTIRVGSGLNSVNRALDLALFMGYEKIYILGADCAMKMKSPPLKNAPQGSPPYLKWLEEETVMHANGDSSVHNGASPITLIGEVDGVMWLSKPDMLPSAVWLEKVRQLHADKVEVIGDTLPNALKNKPDEFLNRLPTLVDGSGKALKIA